MSADLTPRLRCAVGLPNIRDHADPRLIARLATVAEAAGWDGLFLWDHLADADSSVPATDPWIAIAAAATATRELRLGVMITPLARRRPWKVARESVAMDVLSDGRFHLGVGLGGDPQAEFADFGDPAEPRVRARRLDEGLEILTGLWSGEPVSFHGEHHDVEPYVAAGLTWWIEKLGWFRGDPALVQRRIAAGPPRLEG